MSWAESGCSRGERERGELFCRGSRSFSCQLRSGQGGVFGEARTDPQARPRSAIDCSAFPINYSLIMENRQRLAPWLQPFEPHHCSQRRGRPGVPAPLCLPAARGGGKQPPACPRSCPTEGQGPGTETLAMEMGGRWEPRDPRGAAGSCSHAHTRGQLISAEGTIGSLLI